MGSPLSDERSPICRVCSEPDGAAFFECDPPQVAAVSALLAPLGAVDVLRDLAGLDRVVRLRR